MKDIDFTECEFINEVLHFITFDDFCERRKTIKLNFDILSKNGKRFYLWYIYANIHMTERYKNACWGFLNGYLDEAGLMWHKRFYKVI